MCRLFGYILSDFSLLQLALQKTGDALRSEPPIDGWGLGFYQDDRPLLRKRPKVVTDTFDFVELASDIRSTTLLGHLQHNPRGGKASENMQPFRFRNWLFAGLNPENDAFFQALHTRLPDFLKRNIRGQTCSEAALHLFFDVLRKRARIESAILPPAVLFDAARATLDELNTLAANPEAELPPEFSLIFASGRQLLIINQSERPLALLKTEGLEDQEPPLFAGHKPKTLSYPEFRGVAAAFDPAPSELPWQAVPPRHLVVIDARYDIHIEPITPG